MSTRHRISLAGLLTASAIAGVNVSTAESAPPPEPPEQAVQLGRIVQRMSLEEKVGQLFVLFAYGPDANKPDARNTSLYGVATPAEVVAKYKPGGWIYFNARANVESPTQLATYSNQLQATATTVGRRVPLIIATDQEQGVVVRIGPPATQFGGNMAHGATRDTADARTAAAITGSELKAMGIRQDYA